MSFRDLEEGVTSLFKEAAITGERYATDYTHDVERDNWHTKHLRRKVLQPFYKGDLRRRIDAELLSKRAGRPIPQTTFERLPCPHCGELRTHVLTGKRAGHIYHTGKWEELELPCKPISVAA